VAAAALVVAGLALLTVGLVRMVGRNGGAKPVSRSIAATLARSTPAVAPFVGWREMRLEVDARCLRLVVAGTETEQRTGLTGRLDLGPYDGMVFAMPSDTRTAFTMAGAPLPLDLGLYSSSGLPLERHELIPCPASVDRCPLTTPAHDYRFAIETRRGALPSGAVTGCGR
jgi:uncharacterized membrane protein (UPF0127 family)